MSKIPTRDRVNPDTIDTTPKRRPEWIKVRAPGGETHAWLQELMNKKSLHTVCEEAGCPNMGECWGSGTATFLLMGDVCTRRCGFCDIKRGHPMPLDLDEPRRVAQAVKAMGLQHAVLTSVTRDDVPDGGASIFASVIRQIREQLPGCSVEVLIPDFKGSLDLLQIVLEARPEILNHNVETVSRLFRRVQPQDKYEWTKEILRNAKQLEPEVLTKSGLMVGLGEEWDEIKETLMDLQSWDVDIITIGQYLQPSRRHLPISRYYTPQEFEDIAGYARSIGFRWVECSPLVRSSYHASEQVRALSSIHKDLYGNQESN